MICDIIRAYLNDDRILRSRKVITESQDSTQPSCSEKKIAPKIIQNQKAANKRRHKYDYYRQAGINIDDVIASSSFGQSTTNTFQQPICCFLFVMTASIKDKHSILSLSVFLKDTTSTSQWTSREFNTRPIARDFKYCC